jgi:hypothetical protein
LKNSLYDKKSRKKAKLKEKINRWKYLCDAEEVTQDIFTSYENELNLVISELFEFSKINHLAKEEHPTSESSTNFRSSIDTELCAENFTSENPEWAKKLYKKIAIQTHPDKLDKMEISSEDKVKREAIFKKAALCLQDENYDILLKLAHELDIEIELDDQVFIKVLENSIRKLSKKIEKFHDLAPWAWGELEGNSSERYTLLLHIWAELEMPEISKEAIRDYIECYEKNGNSLKWHKQYRAPATRIRPESRKPGSRPLPSVAQVRRKK